MEMVEKEGDQMESKTSKERWIYATAELYGVSVEDIHAILDQCKEFYGNKLDFEQQKKYVRGVLDKVAPMKYFQFTGHAGEAGFREKPNGGYKHDYEWDEYIPQWFRGYCYTFNEDGRRSCHIATSLSNEEDGTIVFADPEKGTANKGDYIIRAYGVGIVAVPKAIFESTYQKDEDRLYQYLNSSRILYFDEEGEQDEFKSFT